MILLGTSLWLGQGLARDILGWAFVGWTIGLALPARWRKGTVPFRPTTASLYVKQGPDSDAVRALRTKASKAYL